MSPSRAAARQVLSPCIVEAMSSVWSASHDRAVVVVLTVVLPAALITDVVNASFVEGEMPAAGARVRSLASWCEDVELLGVRVEPRSPSSQFLLVGHGRILVGL